MAIYPGAVVRLTCTAKDAAGELVDPAALTCDIVDPAGTVTAYEYGVDDEFGRTSEGIYPLDVELSRAGTYAYRFTSTDPQAVIEGEIEVAKSAF